MTIFATSIGVGKHSDKSIRELVGARRDALALDALFRDTMPGAVCTLLTDADATATAILNTMSETLQNSGTDDVVIFCFSGHGTPDHRW